MATKYDKKSQDKVEKSMHEFKRGKLKSGSGAKVKSREQAIAIGLSEAREEGSKAPKKKTSSAKSSSTAGKSSSTKASGTKSKTKKPASAASSSRAKSTKTTARKSTTASRSTSSRAGSRKNTSMVDRAVKVVMNAADDVMDFVQDTAKTVRKRISK